TLYYMLTGKPPSTGNTIFQLRDKHLKSPLPPLDTFINNVHPGLSYIVSRMLAKSPDMRYQNMNELMADLGRVFDALTGKGEGKEFAYYLDRHKVGKHLKRRLFVGLILVAVVITLILLQMYRVKNGGRQGADDGVRVNERELEAIVEELLKRYERELMAQRTRSIQERLKESIGERIDGLAKEGGWDAAKKEDVRRVAFRMTEKLFELFGVNWEEWVVPVSENREEIEKIEKELETELNGIIGKEETEKLLHLLRDILIPLGALKRTSP
ncbi:MAG: hypothetical protein N2234_02795, partial [Planctomycetota bacterium]|nr:hypothetical protein [Planctomycetota bacterium]